MKSENLKSHLLLHLVVIIYGFTAIIGRLITIPAVNLVWFRMLIAMVLFFVWLKIKKIPIKVSVKEAVTLLSIGAIVALHWISFFGAIKISNISVTLGCMSATTLFTSLLEPIIFKKRVDPIEVIIGVVIILGLYLIFQFETQYRLGISVALVAAVLAALFTILNRGAAQKHSPAVISLYEMLGGVIVLSGLLLFQGDIGTEMFNLSISDWVWITILASICTAFAFSLSVWVMKKLSAFTVVLAINMEPVYGILLAYLFFKEEEQMSTQFYIGTILILVAVVLHPLIKSRVGRGKDQ